MGRLPRNFAPVDTNLFSDTKIRGLSSGAKLLFVAALLDCNREQTDGQLKRSDVDHLIRLVNVKKSSRAELLCAGLWLETATGVEVVGFLDHNKSKAERDKAAADAKVRKDEWLRNHANDAYSAVDNGVPNGVLKAFPSSTEKQRLEIQSKEQAAIGGFGGK